MLNFVSLEKNLEKLAATLWFIFRLPPLCKMNQPPICSVNKMSWALGHLSCLQFLQLSVSRWWHTLKKKKSSFATSKQLQCIHHNCHRSAATAQVSSELRLVAADICEILMDVSEETLDTTFLHLHKIFSRL